MVFLGFGSYILQSNNNFKIKIGSNALIKLRSENLWKLRTAIIKRPIRLQPGVPKLGGGGGGYIPPIIWLHPPNNLTMVCIWALDGLWTIVLVFTWFRGQKLFKSRWRPFFRSSLDFGDKNSSSLGEDLFFGLHLICLREKNSGRASSPVNVEYTAKLG